MKFQEEDTVFCVFKFIANTPQFGKHIHTHTYIHYMYQLYIFNKVIILSCTSWLNLDYDVYSQ